MIKNKEVVKRAKYNIIMCNETIVNRSPQYFSRYLCKFNLWLVRHSKPFRHSMICPDILIVMNTQSFSLYLV